MRFLFAVLFIALPTLSSAQTTSTSMPILVAGYARLTVEAPHRANPLSGSIWYPVRPEAVRPEAGKPDNPTVSVGDNPVFQGVPALADAVPKAGRHPLVILSHGAGGNIDNAAWLAAALARRGIIVAGVNHPGSTTGDVEQRRAVQVWLRPQDGTAVLNALLAHPVFGRHIDPDRITALGFSLGGHTALALGGARLDYNGYLNYCSAAPDRLDCRFFTRSGGQLSALPKPLFESSGQDRRVNAVIALDPGLINGFSPTALASIDRPVTLINLGTQATIPPALNARAAASHLPHGRYIAIPGAIHFSFLGRCKPQGPALLVEEGEDPICDDGPGRSREDVHNALIAIIAQTVLAHGQQP